MYTGEPDGTGETQRQPISTIKQCVRKLQTLSREVAVSHLVWTNSDPKRTCSCWAGRGQTSEGERVRQQEQQPGRGKAQCIADWQQYTSRNVSAVVPGPAPGAFLQPEEDLATAGRASYTSSALP